MRPSKSLENMKSQLVAGTVYRRSYFEQFTSNVDRHLATLVKEGQLKKLSYGLYTMPKATPFGEGLPDEQSLLRTFLNDDHFVVYSMSQFNSLELGTTQLHNRRIVFNRKRVGEFEMGGRHYYFYRWREAPKQLTPEFLVVELLNHLDDLGEDPEKILARLKEKLHTFDLRKLKKNASHYGVMATQKTLKNLMHELTGK